MASVEQLVENNRRFVEEVFGGPLPVRPSRHIAVVACMDSRMDIFGMVGLGPGEAHVIRNAGGVVTDDVLRSLVISQRRLGTEAVLLIHHTDCGLEGLDEDAFGAELEEAAGERPDFAIGSFRDPFADTRESVERLRASPFLLHTDQISGFVYDVATGRLLPAGD
jgi:carbonic anhydrase